MKAVELCCGAGGLSLGFGTAGIEIVGAVDNCPKALAVYKANLPHPTLLMNIRNVGPVARVVRDLRADMLFGGPPCQDFSSAGKKVEGENAAMIVDFSMVAAIAKTEWIVIENVPGILKSKAWAEAEKILKAAGYGLSITEVNAAYYGVPQNRDRVFIIGRLGEADGFMEAAIKNAASPQPMTLRQALEGAVPDFIYTHARYPDRRSVYSADEAMPTIRSASRRSVPQRHFDEVADLLAAGHVYMRPYRSGRGVRTLDEPTAAIIRTSKEGPGPKYLKTLHPRDSAHPSQASPLTQALTAFTQGFPLWWDWSAGGTLRDIDQMIANAVPAPLARAIATLILEREAGETPPIDPGFLKSLRKAKGLGEKAIQNVTNSLREACRLLNGRTYANHREELYRLATTVEFAALKPRNRARIRNALKMHQEWRSTKAGKAAVPVHAIPERGGLRAVFREVGRRMGARHWRPAHDRAATNQPPPGRRRADTRATPSRPIHVSRPPSPPIWPPPAIEICRTFLNFATITRRMTGPP